MAALQYNVRLVIKSQPRIFSSIELKVLVAEDEFEIANSYRLMLGKRNHSVVLTADGWECIETYRSEFSSGSRLQNKTPYDLVILDMKMPRVDGLAAAKEILSICSSQRIIIASASPADNTLQSLQWSNGRIQIIQKPFQLRDLISLVEADKDSLPERRYYALSDSPTGTGYS